MKRTLNRPVAAQATREDLGVVVSLSREGDDVDDVSFVVEAAHSPHGLSQGRVSQKTAVPLRRTAFCYGEWHHFYVEGRGRTRLSLFGRDELSAWIDGEEILSRCSFLFPTAISSPGYEPAAARDGFGYGYYGAPKAPQAAHELDDCAFGRGLDGQLGAVYVLSECVTASQRDSLSCRYSERGFRARLVAEKRSRDPRRVADARGPGGSSRADLGGALLGGGFRVDDAGKAPGLFFAAPAAKPRAGKECEIPNFRGS